MKNKLVIGVVLIILAVGIVFYVAFSGEKGGMSLGSAKSVKIIYGSEKNGFLQDEQVLKILSSRYKLEIEGTRMGSIEMVKGNITGIDGLWPSSELAAGIFDTRGIKNKKYITFRTPIVLYSWPEVTENLKRGGIVKETAGAFTLDMRRFTELVKEGKSWKDLGLDSINGKVTIRSTNPSLSNSGFLITGLLSVLLNDGNMIELSQLTNAGDVGEKIKDIYKRMGYLENSSGILFENYINQGIGAYPVIAGYENQLIEFYQTNPRYQQRIKEMVRVMLPEPTVWSAHPFIALTSSGEALMAALQDEELQKIAWTRYGFRTGVVGLDLDPEILTTLGLSETIRNVLSPPSPEVMDGLLELLANK